MRWSEWKIVECLVCLVCAAGCEGGVQLELDDVSCFVEETLECVFELQTCDTTGDTNDAGDDA